MITKEQLIKAKQERDKQYTEYKKQLEEINKPFFELLELYDDQILLDKNNSPVKIGHTITDGKNKYKVHYRGMQCVFGELLFNSRVFCKKVSEDGKIAPNAREKTLHSSELKNYWIV
ncbi:TPA: hypothetical protein JRX31_000314 [Elizabethkingia anophelis]|nr:hypothetical protein [Elizabethkingia anophelis]